MTLKEAMEAVWDHWVCVDSDNPCKWTEQKLITFAHYAYMRKRYAL